MAGNRNLSNAKAAKNDEFYTRLPDIEDELWHYEGHFKGRTVLCNCDDPYESAFFMYFAMNFNRLGLKKLIATSYAGSLVAGKSYGAGRGPYKAVVTSVRDATGDGGIGMEDVAALFDMGENELTPLSGDGDFRSQECLALLDEADIVVTNPPFSLFREYVAVLMEHDKKFIILGNQNAITYREFFPLLKDNRVWLGYHSNKTYTFIVPESYESGARDEDGNKTVRVPAITWFTNLEIKKHREDLFLADTYSPEKYPRYDNYDAIEVSKVSNIPKDYAGVMGVPITFMDKYSPDQFEILWCTQRGCHDEIKELRQYDDYWEMRQDGTKTGSSGNKTNGNPNLLGNNGKHNYFINSEGRIVQSAYNRIFIRNRHPELPEDSFSEHMNTPEADKKEEAS